MSAQAPSYTIEDLTAGFQNLLPTGPVWPRDPDAVQSQVATALMNTPLRLTARAANLLQDAFPVEPVELLPEWELTLGLPDPCAGASPSLQIRQQQVAARFVAGGGQSVAYFVNLAATLGYTITITQFTPYRVGMPVGQPISGPAWAFVWQVNAPQFSIHYFEVGRDSVGEALASWDNTVLQCEIQKYAPAHTTVLFNYS